MRISFSYRPSEKVRKFEGRIIETIRRKMKDENYVLWRDDLGVWKVSYIFPDRQWMDMVECGNEQQPYLSPGIIRSVKSMWRASQLGRGPLRGLDGDIETKRKITLRQNEDRMQKDLDRRRYIRRRLSRINGVLADHPYLKV